MKLENQLVNFELSKRLKELNCKQESLFYWVHWAKGYGKEHVDYEKNLIWKLRYENNIGYDQERLSAFTVSELGEMLPVRTWTEKHNQRYEVTVRHIEVISGKKTISADTEANVRAKILIYLKESKDK